MRTYYWLGVLALAGWCQCRVGLAEEPTDPAAALLFHASFDHAADADFARGDARIHTGDSLARENSQAGLHADGVARQPDGGRYGGCLTFTKKTAELVFYRGGANVPYAEGGFEGTVSFWMRLSPATDLPPGYVDPLQITDKKWNDASLFIDFTENNPRQFRLGVFADYAFWNPRDVEWDDIPVAARPMVTVDDPPFAGDRWTHVAITFAGFNGEQNADAALYLDGQLQGRLDDRQQFTWNRDEVVIMLGIAYVGRLDDLAVFSRALTADEVGRLLKLPQGIHSLRGPD